MSWRYAYGALAALIIACPASASEVIVTGSMIHTLRYTNGPGPQYEVLDTLQNDSVWIIWGDSVHSWNLGQSKLVSFRLPTTTAACDCLYITVTAVDLSLETFHGRTGIGMDLFPRDSTDTTAFQFRPWGSWRFLYTYDSLQYGQTYVHRTYLGLDAYFAYTLDRDYPACRDIIMAIGPSVVGDTHFVITSTMHWFTQALSAADVPDPPPAYRSRSILILLSRGSSIKGRAAGIESSMYWVRPWTRAGLKTKAVLTCAQFRPACISYALKMCVPLPS